MGSKPSCKLTLLIIKYSNLLLHFELVVIGPRLNKRPIEFVSVESCKHSRPRLLDVLIELNQKLLFIWLVKHSEGPDIEIFFGRVLKISNVLAYNLAVGYQKPAAVNDVGNHHDLVESDVWELQFLLSGFNIKCKYPQLSLVLFVLEMREFLHHWSI